MPQYELFKLELLWFIHAFARRRNVQTYNRTETPYLLASIDKRVS
jgi:hypothetical protein